ncbi:hypothetical protein QCA50_006849 [Cerrena zonata]|uniref:Uncharacterized protein n=1 Tax=Cerrena zonata TaxID=2478898 RepID=A0AAW0GIY1_9APHY
MMSVVTNSNNESEPIVASSSQLHHDIRCNQPVAPYGGSWVKVEDGTPLLNVSHSFDSSVSPADSHSHRHLFPVESTPLIETSRPFRPPTLQPVHLPSSLVPASTLTSNYKHPPQYNSGNGVPHHQLSSSSYDNSAVTSHHGHSSSTHHLSSAPSQYVPINTISNSPRTSHPVFHTTSALAAHHGIPQSLPPVPRTTRYNTPSASSVSPTNDFDFTNLCSNYLSMLSQKPVDTQSQTMVATTSNTSTNVDPSTCTAEEACMQAFMEVIQGDFDSLNTTFVTPLIHNDSIPLSGSPGDLEFLTSPMEDSPFEDFLSTPAIGMNDDVVPSISLAPP